MTKNKTGVWALGILLALGLLLVVLYNGLASSREEILTRESDIATQLQRRGDLIPNLVKTVKRFTEHETAVIDKVTSARAQLAGARSMAAKAQADAALTSALQGLLVVVENYPQIKADTVYTGLMDELSGTENRIAVARKNYNDAVRLYNQRLVGFPGNIIGGMLGFTRAEYFTANPASTTTPDVGSGL